MDTGDLSIEAYDGIIIEAEKLAHDLTLRYGLLSYDSKDENEFVDKAEKLCKEITNLCDDELDDLFWGNPPDKEKLELTLEKIITNIGKIRKIPIEERHYE